MSSRTTISAALLALALAVIPLPGHSSAEAELAEKLALALVSGRAVVAVNQPLINDPEQGDKGLSADAFIDKLAEDYAKRAGIDLRTLAPDSDLNRALLAFVAASRDVVTEIQPVINRKGMAFKGFTPAVYGRETGTRFSQRTGLGLKQTSALYRNAANKPDEFETRVLQQLESGSGDAGYGEIVTEGGSKAYRYMKPLYITQACLSCHGDPKGERDIAGRIKEGYKLGELRGAISVSVPLP